MKNLICLSALGLALTGCAGVAPQGDQTQTGLIFQADTTQSPAHIAQCVAAAYRGRSDIKISDLLVGGQIVASLPDGSTAEVIMFVATPRGTRVAVSQIKAEQRDPYGFVKQARACGIVFGSQD